MIKCQIPIGGRAKAGGVYEVRTEAEAEVRIKQLLGSKVRGYLVKELLIEEKIDFVQELFCAVTYDTVARAPVVVVSTSGGIDVEELSTTGSGLVGKKQFAVRNGISESAARALAEEAGFSGRVCLNLAEIIVKLVELFLASDATLAEINPLVLAEDEKLIAVDVHIEIDDDALFRQEKIVELQKERVQFIGDREMTQFEREGAQIDKVDHRGVAGRIIDFDGDLGLVIGGGGASLTAFDAVTTHGGRPANYSEVGGNPSVWKVKELTKLILSKPTVRKIAVISNIVSNTRVDLIARGVIKGILELGRNPSEVLAVFRVPGAWEEEGQKILKKYGITFYDRRVSIDRAAKQAVERGM
jgi:succinyl-CoA synthetase beta subunit/citryl-CoA synthetase large subunit